MTARERMLELMELPLDELRTVEVETVLGRKTTYQVRQSFDGFFRKSVEDPSGFKSYYVDTTDDLLPNSDAVHDASLCGLRVSV